VKLEGSAAREYKWYASDNDTLLGSDKEIQVGLDATKYYKLIVKDVNGCFAETTITLTVIQG
jgi:hypothetical protein